MRDKPQNHSIYFGAFDSAALSKLSKSRSRFIAATAMIARLIPIPNIPLECSIGIFQPKKLPIKLIKYTKKIAPVAIITPALNFSVTVMRPDLYNTNIDNKVPKVRHTACKIIPSIIPAYIAEMVPKAIPSKPA